MVVEPNKSDLNSRAQEYVNDHYTHGKVTILVHGMDTIVKALKRNSLFFCKVQRDGQLLYTKHGLTLSQYTPCEDATVTETEGRAMVLYMIRYTMAEDFRDCALSCYEQQRFKVALFMFHQAVEQSCKAILNVYLDYKPDIHHLGRLIDLTYCFCDELMFVFPRRTAEEKRLFSVLLNSYSDARYNDYYNVSIPDAGAIRCLVNEFLDLTKDLCLNRLPSFVIEQAETHTEGQN